MASELSSGWAEGYRSAGGGGDVGGVRPVDVVQREAEVVVQRPGGLIGCVYVQHGYLEATGGEVLETGHGESASVAATSEVRIDGDDVDLPEVRLVVGVDLRPAEPS